VRAACHALRLLSWLAGNVSDSRAVTGGQPEYEVPEQENDIHADPQRDDQDDGIPVPVVHALLLAALPWLSQWLPCAPVMHQIRKMTCRMENRDQKIQRRLRLSGG
jgi:hypothetical protein